MGGAAETETATSAFQANGPLSCSGCLMHAASMAANQQSTHTHPGTLAVPGPIRANEGGGGGGGGVAPSRRTNTSVCVSADELPLLLINMQMEP